MTHIAEITLPNSTAFMSFDPANKRQVAELEEVLGEWAEEGLVYGVEFHTSQ